MWTTLTLLHSCSFPAPALLLPWYFPAPASALPLPYSHPAPSKLLPCTFLAPAQHLPSSCRFFLPTLLYPGQLCSCPPALLLSWSWSCPPQFGSLHHHQHRTTFFWHGESRLLRYILFLDDPGYCCGMFCHE